MANFNFNTSNSTFRQLFANGLRYKIPPFQRDYSWGVDEWDDLWQDITIMFSEEGEESHYMGYLVLQSSDNKRFDVIDGQQRITTISVMILSSLATLLDIAKEGEDSENNKKRVEQFRNGYIGYIDPVTLIPISKLELNRHNNRFYQTYLVPLDTPPQRGLNSSEQLLRKAFFWFKDKISAYAKKDGVKLAQFIDAVVDKLFFTVITVTDELNAFTVFETLNARGVRLSATDLLKNYLFSIVNKGGVHETEIKSLEETWEKIVGELGSESFPEFLRIYWNSKNKLVRKTELFKTIRKKISTKEQAFSLIRSLDKSSSIYAALRNHNDELWSDEEKNYLAELQMFNVRQPLAVLMASFSKFAESNREIFTKILKSISILSFRYNVICNMQTHDQERLYSDIAFRLSNGEIESLKEVYSALATIYPDDSTFKAAFADKELKTTNSRNKKVVRYILFKMEQHLSGQDFDFESSYYNLEHIMPENPSDEWGYIDDQTHERVVYRLGNITVLETRLNKEVGNHSYQKKAPIYKKSAFSIAKNLPDNYDEWDENKVNARQKHMANIASAIWRIDNGKI